jgi:hypothetical protein
LLRNTGWEDLIKANVNGNFTDKEIADVQVISISSLQQLYREYKSTKLGDIKGLILKALGMK